MSFHHFMSSQAISPEHAKRPFDMSVCGKPLLYMVFTSSFLFIMIVYIQLLYVFNDDSHDDVARFCYSFFFFFFCFALTSLLTLIVSIAWSNHLLYSFFPPVYVLCSAVRTSDLPPLYTFLSFEVSFLKHLRLSWTMFQNEYEHGLDGVKDKQTVKIPLPLYLKLLSSPTSPQKGGFEFFSAYCRANQYDRSPHASLRSTTLLPHPSLPAGGLHRRVHNSPFPDRYGWRSFERHSRMFFQHHPKMRGRRQWQC